MADDTYPFYPDGPHYRCAHCNEVLPDGAAILGHWASSGSLLGVRAEQDGVAVHECGRGVEPAPEPDLTGLDAEAADAAIIDALNDPDYLAKVQHSA